MYICVSVYNYVSGGNLTWFKAVNKDYISYIIHNLIFRKYQFYQNKILKYTCCSYILGDKSLEY